MKTKKFALLIILSMLVTGFAGADSYIVEDDIYYNPNDKNPVVEKKEKDLEKKYLELDNKKFIMGIKWHPELMLEDEFPNKLFNEFISKCNNEHI